MTTEKMKHEMKHIIIVSSLTIIIFVLIPIITGEMCPDNVIGKIEKFKELSGIVASPKYPVLYSIEDSQNKESVYVFLENGTLVGEMILENVKQEDFEDIALASGPKEGVDYIYVGDIGNNWKGHCKGINEPNKKIYMFPEPNVDLFSESGVITIPHSEIKIIELIDPTLKGVTKCHPNTQVDTETLLVDSLTNSGYLIQKVHIAAKCCNDFSGVRILKFKLPLNSNKKTTVAQLKRVGTIPINPESFSPLNVFDVKWPLLITAGDISSDGEKIILRSYNEIRIWQRNVTGESVEDALTKSDGNVLEFCPEYQGEAIAFEPGGKGFYTTTEISRKNSSHKFAPIYYYSLSLGKLSNANMLKTDWYLPFLFFIIALYQIVK